MTPEQRTVELQQIKKILKDVKYKMDGLCIELEDEPTTEENEFISLDLTLASCMVEDILDTIKTLKA